MKNQTLTNNKVDRDTTKNIVLNGRRVVSAGTSVDPDDYVTKAELTVVQSQVDAIKKKLGLT